MQNVTANRETVVSVIIPTFNRGHCLSRTIQSVLDQTFQKFEIIIIDNNSTDNTNEVIAGFDDERINLLKIQNKGVVAASRNLGISNAVGKYVAFLDSDDWWLPNKLQSCLDTLSNGLDLVYHDLFLKKSRFSFTKRRMVMRCRNLVDPVFDDLLFNGNTIFNSSVVVDRMLLIDTGGISENNELVGCEDFDCWLKISQATNSFGRVNGVHGCYWIGDDNLTSHSRKLMNLKAMAKKYAPYFDLSDGEAFPAWMLYGLSRSHFGLGEIREALRYSRLAMARDLSPVIRLKSIFIYLYCKLRRA